MSRFIRRFGDWLKNPRLFRSEADEYRRQMEELLAPASPKAIQAMVEQLLLIGSDPLTHERIKAQGTRAVPALVRALQDPRFRTEKIGRGMAAMWPVERVTGLLALIGPPEAAGPALTLFEHEDESVRAAAARLLGSIGNDDCREAVTRALRDESDEVRMAAARGIETAVKDKHCSQGFLEAIFEPLAAQLDHPESGYGSDVSELLLQIDRARAMSILLSDRFFHVECSRLGEILRAVNSVGERIPADKLHPLLQALRPHLEENPYSAAYTAALVALARSGSPDAESLIRKDLASEDSFIRRGAADALAALKGAMPPQEYFFQRIGSLDYERLSHPQRICYCVDELIREVNNGGFSQYFFNSSGDHARDTLAALDTVNGKCTAVMLRKAIDLFGRAGPSADCTERQDQLAAFSEQQDAELKRLNSEFFEYPDNLEALLSLYAAEHPEDFRCR